MAVADRNVLRASVCAESATPHEVRLAMSTLLQMVVPGAPQNLIGDNDYDSDRLDAAHVSPLVRMPSFRAASASYGVSPKATASPATLPALLSAAKKSWVMV